MSGGNARCQAHLLGPVHDFHELLVGILEALIEEGACLPYQVPDHVVVQQAAAGAQAGSDVPGAGRSKPPAELEGPQTRTRDGGCRSAKARDGWPLPKLEGVPARRPEMGKGPKNRVGREGHSDRPGPSLHEWELSLPPPPERRQSSGADTTFVGKSPSPTQGVHYNASLKPEPTKCLTTGNGE